MRNIKKSNSKKMTAPALRRNSAFAEIIQLKKRPKNRNLKIFVVEGITDKFLFDNLLKIHRDKFKILPAYRVHFDNSPCSNKNSSRYTPYITYSYQGQNNKREVIKTIQKCNNEEIGYLSVYGIIDADFMYISRKIRYIKNLIYTTYHDIDIEIFTMAGILDNFLQDFFPERQLEVDAIRKLCLDIATEFGKYLCILERKRIYSSERKEKNFLIENYLKVENSNLSLNVRFIKEDLQNYWNILSEDIENGMSNLNLNNQNPKRIANGHSFFAVLWQIKEKELYGLSRTPKNSEFLNLNFFECEKKLKLCYVQAQMFEKNFWDRICDIILE